ncbi:MAG TPA: hypothetical protein VN843_29300 [Anaerolineales bacterium]|nr:hypothetical protein [Anaerolineales bacterium]
MEKLPDFDLYKIDDILVQAKRVIFDNGAVYYDVILPGGARGYYGQISFEDIAVKVNDADNR